MWVNIVNVYCTIRGIADVTLAVNVGSVGQPRRLGDNRASYLLTDGDTLEFRRVEYDVKTSAEKIFGSDLEPNFGHRLFIGV